MRAMRRLRETPTASPAIASLGNLGDASVPDPDAPRCAAPPSFCVRFAALREAGRLPCEDAELPWSDPKLGERSSSW